MKTVKPKLAIPIHIDDHDVFKSPLLDFTKAWPTAGLENWVHYLVRGDADNFQWRGEDVVI